MKVLHLSTLDHLGGAFIAARRLHCTLREEDGVRSEFCVARKFNGSPDTIGLHSRLAYSLRRRIERLPLALTKKNLLIYYSLGWLPNFKILRHARKTSPGIIHLHWVQNGFVPLSALPRFNKPIIWTFHDMWPFTGMRHHEYENPPRCAGSYDRTSRPAGLVGPDLDAWTWRRKREVYDKIKVCGVVPSRWMEEKAKASSLWQDRPLRVIPNGIDTSLYKPADQEAARKSLRLPSDKEILLFGAMFANTDKNKGFDQLVEALEILKAQGKSNLFLAVFGIDECPEGVELPFPAKFMGVVRDETEMAKLYNAADVMVVPSLQESFGLTACESLSCGTPVACFDTSGLKDIVDHETGGYRAKAFDTGDLAHGIEWMLESGGRRRQLGDNAREKVRREFDLEVVAKRHLELYHEFTATG